jgi:hypothetical protein
MILGSLDRDRLALLGGEPDQPLVELDAHPANRLGRQAAGGGQSEVLDVRSRQVDRAGVRLQATHHQVDHVVERLVEIVRPADESRDVGQQGDSIRNG